MDTILFSKGNIHEIEKAFRCWDGFPNFGDNLASAAQADTSSDVQKVIDESYVQPDYVMGYSLSEEERNQTLNLLSYDSSKDTNVKTLTTTAYANIMNVADDSSLQLYSSVKIAKLGATNTECRNCDTTKYHKNHSRYVS